jgi:hypothetical protein
LRSKTILSQPEPPKAPVAVRLESGGSQRILAHAAALLIRLASRENEAKNLRDDLPLTADSGQEGLGDVIESWAVITGLAGMAGKQEGVGRSQKKWNLSTEAV